MQHILVLSRFFLCKRFTHTASVYLSQKCGKTLTTIKMRIFFPNFGGFKQQLFIKGNDFSLYFLLIIIFKSRSQTSWHVTQSQFVSRCRT